MASESDRRSSVLSSLLRIKEYEQHRLVSLLEALNISPKSAETRIESKQSPQESEESERLAGEKANLQTFADGLITEIDRIITEIRDETGQNRSKSAEYALESGDFIREFQPLFIDSCLKVRKKPYPRVVFLQLPISNTAKSIVQQGFFISKSVAWGREQLQSLENEYIGLRLETWGDKEKDLVDRVEAVLLELPQSPSLKLTYLPIAPGPSACAPLPTTLHYKLIFDLLTIPIAISSHLSYYSAAEQWRSRALQAYSKRSDTDCSWGLDINPCYIGSKGQTLYSAALAENTVQSYRAALDFWYNLAPFGEVTEILLAKLGDLHYEKKEESMALISYRKAEVILSKRKSTSASSVPVYLRLGQLLRTHCNNSSTIIKCLKEALRVCEANPEEKGTLTDVLFFLAKMYSEGNALEKAEETFKSCLDIMEREGSQYKKLAGVYYHFGVLQQKSHQYSLAESFFDKALSADCHLVDNFNPNDLYLSLTDLYRVWNKPKQCELTHMRALIHSINTRSYSLVADWGNKMIANYRSVRDRDREERTACKVLGTLPQGPYFYNRYESQKAIRGIYT